MERRHLVILRIFQLHHSGAKRTVALTIVTRKSEPSNQHYSLLTSNQAFTRLQFNNDKAKDAKALGRTTTNVLLAEKC